jgi:hypothetical protein
VHPVGAPPCSAGIGDEWISPPPFAGARRCGNMRGAAVDACAGAPARPSGSNKKSDERGGPGARAAVEEDAVIQFPLTMSFKIAAFNPQVRVVDATGRLVAYGKQKALKLKEDITIFEDEGQQRPLFRVHADRVIDWGARYTILDPLGTPLGALRREGARSLWKATYHIEDRNGARIGLIHEESGWTKFGDALFGEVPVLGLLAGYVFHPAYLVDVQGETVFYLKKQPAFLEGSFKVDQRKDVVPEEQRLLLASTILAVMLERWRG